jgi:hypothetical protein
MNLRVVVINILQNAVVDGFLLYDGNNRPKRISGMLPLFI